MLIKDLKAGTARKDLHSGTGLVTGTNRSKKASSKVMEWAGPCNAPMMVGHGHGVSDHGSGLAFSSVGPQMSPFSKSRGNGLEGFH